ncbi:hypothetical protein ACLM5J_08565 [Nocardioides sp. Bht2]|uniref:hypothetical protein n=1 Tax=Nocardioides sp. Bht2 TaxID=3392297 RepID=UPI0039B40D06
MIDDDASLAAEQRRIETVLRRICYALALIGLPWLVFMRVEGTCPDDASDCHVLILEGLFWAFITFVATAVVCTIIAIRIDLKRRFGAKRPG